MKSDHELLEELIKACILLRDKKMTWSKFKSILNLVHVQFLANSK